jgi:hypothetical protein
MEIPGGGGSAGGLDPATPPHPAAIADHAATQAMAGRIFRDAGC